MKCLGFHLNSDNLRLSPCGNLQLVTIKAQSFVHSDIVEKKEPRIDPCNKVVVATMELFSKFCSNVVVATMEEEETQVHREPPPATALVCIHSNWSSIS